jgi:hypothetical protein
MKLISTRIRFLYSNLMSTEKASWAIMTRQAPASQPNPTASLCVTSFFTILDAFAGTGSQIWLHLYGPNGMAKFWPWLRQNSSRITKRKAFFNSLPPHKQQRIQIESQRITDLRTTFENDHDHGYLVTEFQNELGKWRESQRGGQIEIRRASGPSSTSNESEDPAVAQPPREARILSK